MGFNFFCLKTHKMVPWWIENCTKQIELDNWKRHRVFIHWSCVAWHCWQMRLSFLLNRQTFNRKIFRIYIFLRDHQSYLCSHQIELTLHNINSVLYVCHVRVPTQKGWLIGSHISDHSLLWRPFFEHPYFTFRHYSRSAAGLATEKFRTI